MVSTLGLTRPEIIAFYVLLLIWIGSEARIQQRYRLPVHAANRDRGSIAVVIGSVWIAVAIGFVLAMAIPLTTIRTGREAEFGIGLALMLAGLLLRWYAVAVLGSAFTVMVATRPEQTLVERGPYGLIRHPSYTGSLVTILGVLLCFGNSLSIGAILLPIGGYAYRIHVEERALLDAFGAEYEEYRRRTKALIPFVL